MHIPSFRIKLPVYSVLSIALIFHILSILVYAGNSPAETQQQAIINALIGTLTTYAALETENLRSIRKMAVS
jgi:hypothetical protein